MCHLKYLTAKLCITIIPNGVSRGDAENSALNKAYLACLDFRGIDNLLLQASMKKTAADLYDAVLLDPHSEYLTVHTHLIGDIYTALATTIDQNT